MAVRRRSRANVGYGIDNALQDLAPQVIVSGRAPTANDTAEIGTSWIDQTNDASYVITSVSAGSANWSTAPASGATTLASLIVTTTSDLQGNVDIGGTLDVVGATTVADFTATGTTTISGDLDLTSAALIDLTSTLDADPAIYLRANGGTSEVIRLRADQGTSANSIDLVSDVGGITLSAPGLASDDAINLSAGSGGIDMDAATQINIASSEAATDAIVIAAGNAAGGIDISTGGGDLDILSAGGLNLISTEDAASAISLAVNSGTSETITIVNTQGTAAGAITLTATAGSLDFNAGGSATLDAAAAISLDAATASNFTVTGAGQDLTLASAGGSVAISSTEDTIGAVSITANGGTSETVVITSVQGTGADSVDISSDAGGITLTGALAGDAINLVASAGSINVTSGEDAVDSIYLHANAGTSETIRLHADQGTAAGSVTLESDVGGVSVLSGLAGDAIFLTASAGSILATSGEDAADSIYIRANAGTSETIRLHADQGTAIGSIELESDAGGVLVTTAALAATTGLHVAQGAATAAIQVGAGAPSHNAPKGSLYLRTDGSGVSDRAYIATDAVGTWTALTTAA